MKSAISPGSLSLFLGSVAPALSQREQQEKEKGKPEQGQQQQHAEPRKVKSFGLSATAPSFED